MAIFLLLSVPAWAEIKLELSVSPTTGPINEEFVLQVVLDGSTETPLLIGGEDFKLTFIGPQTSVTIINGDVSRRVAYSYRLFPKKTGEFDSPSAEITIDGTKYQAASVRVKVTEASQAVSQNSDLFLRQSVDKKEVYLGEQLINTLEIYSSLGLYEAQTIDIPIDGFWSENLAEQQKDQRYIDGKSFDLLRVRQALFPLRSGKLIIPVQTLKAKVRERKKSRNPFGMVDPFDQDLINDFFGGGSFKEISVDSNPVEITVKELPSTDKILPNWGGSAPIVGKVDLNLSYDPTPIKAGESKSIKLELKSFGNLNPIKSVPVKIPNWVKIYQETPNSKSTESGDKLLQRRSFNLTLVPTAGGDLNIPPIELGYFDPEDGQYKVARTEPITFNVLGRPAQQLTESSTGDSAAGVPTARSEKVNVQDPIPSGSPQFEQEGIVTRLSSAVTLSTILFWIVAGIALISFSVFAMRVWRQGTHKRKAVQAILSATSLEQAKLAFEQYLCQKLDLADFISEPGPFRARLREKLGVEKALLIETVLDRINFALYSGENNQDLNDPRQELVQVLKSI